MLMGTLLFRVRRISFKNQRDIEGNGFIHTIVMLLADEYLKRRSLKR
jgi:hypothetical protein